MHPPPWECLRVQPVALLMSLSARSVCLFKQSPVAQANLKLALWQSQCKLLIPLPPSPQVLGLQV